jgi:hypothetical protein
MKTRIFSIQLLLLFVLFGCKNDEISTTDEGITFCKYDVEANTTSTLIYYNEIIGYDSTKYAFVLDELVWEKFNREIMQTNFFVYPFPDFVIDINLNNNLIYRAGYVPSYYSTVLFDRVFFRFQKPDIILVQLESPIEFFKGEDLRNDPKLIERLKKDSKLIELKN